jgi:hypothetical protein
MGEYDEPGKAWDEYDWERFLQQQDRKTEHYMELLERYLDDPLRDEIIAREMGWRHLLDDDGKQWVDEVDSLFAEHMELLGDEDAAADEDDTGPESFELHPLYQKAFALIVWLEHFFEENGISQNEPSAVRLAAQASLASAKLAAALSDDDVDEIGMTIAYLKRALRAINNSLQAALHLHSEVELRHDQLNTLNHRLFQVRDGIIVLMGELRAEWRRRFGAA